jgi:hypothetical protein
MATSGRSSPSGGTCKGSHFRTGQTPPFLDLIAHM